MSFLTKNSGLAQVIAIGTKALRAYTHADALHTITVEQPVDNPCKAEPTPSGVTPASDCSFFSHLFVLFLCIDDAGKMPAGD